MRAEEIVFYGTDWKEIYEAWLRGDDLRPVEEQVHFAPSESETLLALIIEDGNYNEYGGEIGNQDWPI